MNQEHNSRTTIIDNIEQANREAARAYWWIKDINPADAAASGVSDQVKTLLSLLQKVDNITIDIAITIRESNTAQLLTQ